MMINGKSKSRSSLDNHYIFSPKSFYRFVEFISKLCGGSLPHGRYKKIALDLFNDSSLLDCEKGEKNRELKEYLASLLNAEVDLINFDHALKNLDISEMENVLIFIKWE